jgi:uncharacterized membrane protein
MNEDAPIFATELRYHRTLSDRGVTIFVLSLAGIAAGVCVLLLWSGLWPIVPFVAGDAVFLAVAMKICVADRAASEMIRFDRNGVRIATFDRRSRKVREEHLPLYGLTLERVTDPDFGLKSLYLSLRGRGVEIARGLAPQQRAQFAETLEVALGAAGLPLWRRDRMLR